MLTAALSYLFIRHLSAMKEMQSTIAGIEEEKKKATASVSAIQTEAELSILEKKKMEEEKKKFEEKNKKMWTMNEAVYKEKKKVDEENEKLLKEKEKLEAEKKKFQEKNKKLWDQSLAIHKEKERIDVMRKEIEEKHHNVTESIRYARRIQRAILPPDEIRKQWLPESFVLYRPKDIVSGDFYWIEKVEADDDDEIILFSAVDCTGHGVPGAFMSIFGFNLLNQALDEHNLKKPAEILDFLSNGVMKKLRMHNEETVVKDGMDLMLCAFHKNKMKLEYAGVHNPLYIVRGEELIQLKADKHAIGDPYEDDFTGYNNYEFTLEKGDQIYVFSDGFCDQFGGPQRRKFMSKNFRETILSMRNLSMAEQRAKLKQVLEDWRGDIEQYDDITVMGVRV
ncbi:MAG TPA: hypothetical protein DEH02_01890 [Bacteroidales bacterium]|nr:MAG: hypothetical protein A2X01_07750 [Bacteroidetes bacterium GWF2_35_48]HBX49799.1 hypothetical protein [Bacteroidales bacterium]